LRLEPVPDENWVAISQAALPPVPAGRFIVHGSHDRARIGRRLHAIEIDAGEAFGTAHHATTLGCLMAIDRMASRHSPARILDLGCGSGVLAIAAARVWPRARVTASDIDAVAIEVARANIVHNRLAHRIATVTATGFGHPALRSAAPFDLVLANILAGPLMLLAPAMRRAVAPGSVIALSGILSEQADAVRAYYGANGFRLEGRHLLNGWSILTLRRLA
jgi:ribosomal protein L11 methyltransferase